MIKAHRHHQLCSMFYHRGLFSFAKDFYFPVVLFCALFLLITSKRCSPYEVQSQYRGNFDASSSYVFDRNVNSDLGSRKPVHLRGLENICPHSNSFCFPSTLTGFLINKVGNESEAIDASGDRVEGFSSGLNQVKKCNLTSYLDHGMFRLFDGRVVSCSSYQPDNFHESPFTYTSSKNGHTDISSRIGTLFDKPGFSDVFSTPPVEIKPFLLDWGQKNVYYPSLAFLTVKNIDTNSVLRIYDPYSSNSQFYSCNSSEISLSPGEIASICFIFLPTKLGPSSAQLVLQTSFGGFLIRARGFALESPYLIKPLSGLDVSSSGRWRKKLSLFNPFNEVLNVKNIAAWISFSSGNTSRSSKAICTVHSVEDSNEYSMSSTKEWLGLENGLTQIAIRPHNWEIGPRKTEVVMEFDVMDHFERREIVGAFCLQLVRSSNTEIETVIVPLGADLNQIKDSDNGHVSVSLEASVQSNTNGSVTVSISVKNDGPYVLSAIKVQKIGDIDFVFQVKSIQGLLLFPRSITQVAALDCAHSETIADNMNCKVLIQINDTTSSQIEIPCVDVISVCSGRKLNFSLGHSRVIKNADYIEEVDTREADESVLKNWKSHATANFISVLNDSEVLFPITQVGNHSSQWIAVKNPSQKPIIAQLILNSCEIIENCRTSDMHLQPSSSGTILAANKSFAPTRYGFSIPKDALTEAFIHPHGSALFGPIFFQPSKRCEWTSLAFIRNNLSGVERLSLRGFGGSFSLTLLEGSNFVQSLEFELISPTLLKFSTPEMEKKSPFCSHSLMKEIYVKNTGDFALEVMRVEVSGSECSLDGFLVLNCKGFSLPPGESKLLQISYFSDFSSATVQRDLELALGSNGILVIPMKASLPIYSLNFCRRSIFWMRLKKIIILIFFAATMLLLLVCLLVPMHDFGSGKVSSTGVNSLCMHLNGKNKKKKNSSTDDPSKMALISSNSEMRDGSDSLDLRVSIDKEKKRRRRKKKKSSCMGLFEVSSSQSGNSTPSSPLSPAEPITPKQSAANRDAFARAPNEQVDKKAILFPSATFPSVSRATVTPYSPFLASTSKIAPHARAPGTRLRNQENGKIGEKISVEEKFTYDIWGDHLFGVQSSCWSKNGKNVSIVNDSESFFVRDPQTLMTNSVKTSCKSPVGG